MAKWGTFKWGTAKWGGSAGAQPEPNGRWVYKLLVDWDGSWTNEAARCTAVRGEGGRQFYVGKGGTSFERIQPTEFTFTLKNHDMRYESYNTSSPLYGNIAPGKAVEFYQIDLETGTQYPLISGRIKDIQPVSGRFEVSMIVVDGLEWLAQAQITIPEKYGAYVSECIRYVLDQAQYPGAREVDASACPVPFFNPDKVIALDCIRDLADAGLGTVFCSKRGTLKYYDLSRTSFTTHMLDQSQVSKEWITRQKWDTVRNDIETVASQWGTTALEEVWSLGYPIPLNTGETYSVKAEFDEARVAQPIRGEDYDGGLTAEGFVPGVGYSTYAPYFTCWLTDITSTSATVWMRNDAGNGLILSFLRIRGNRLKTKKLTYPAKDEASIKKWGPRRLRLESIYLQDRGFASAFAPLLLAHLKEPSRDPVVTVRNRPEALAIELFDKLELTSAQLGISETFDVGYLSYRWVGDSGGQDFEVSIYTQHVLYSNSAITAQPYYPISNTPGPATPYGSGDCLETGANAQGTNGPIALSGSGTIDVGAPTLTIVVDRWLRPSSHSSHTFIEIDARREAFASGNWGTSDVVDFSTVVAYNSGGAAVATGTAISSGAGNGVWRYRFDNEGPVYCHTIVLSAPNPERTYTLGAYVAGASGVPATDQVAGSPALVVGNWYAVQNDGGGGGWRTNGAAPYCWSVRVGTSAGNNDVFSLGLDYIGATATLLKTVGAAGGAAYAEAVDALTARGYFRATQSVYYIGPNETGDLSDNSGTVGYSLYNVTTEDDTRIMVRGVSIYNSCPGGAG